MKVDSEGTSGIAGQKRGGGKVEIAANRHALIAKLCKLYEPDADMPVMIAAERDIKYDEVTK